MNNVLSIEQLGHNNGQRYWWAHEISNHLGYKTYASFKKVISRAINSCEKMGIDWADEFQPCIDNNVSTFKLSRFALFLVVQQADNKKEEVKIAKLTLAGVANEMFNYIERISKRQELSDNERVMTAAAIEHGLPNDQKWISIFKDKGYRGLYNMSLNDLKKHKGADGLKGTLYDYMNTFELAANSFRAELTAERIKRDNLSNTKDVINVALDVGQQVREIVIQNTGTPPEDIQLEEDKINKAKTKLKKQRSDINQLKFDES